MDIGVIFSIIGLACGFGIATIGSIREKMPTVVFGIFLICFNAVVIYMGAAEKSEPTEPTALDVYRGRTTLKITYEDSVATDSIVVFKKGYD